MKVKPVSWAAGRSFSISVYLVWGAAMTEVRLKMSEVEARIKQQAVQVGWGCGEMTSSSGSHKVFVSDWLGSCDCVKTAEVLVPCDSRHRLFVSFCSGSKSFWIWFRLNWNIFQLNGTDRGKRRVRGRGERSKAKQVAGERSVGGGEGEARRQGDHLKLRFEEDERQRGCRERTGGRRVDQW